MGKHVTLDADVSRSGMSERMDVMAANMFIRSLLNSKWNVRVSEYRLCVEAEYPSYIFPVLS